jgi:lysyl-tRNA synthetase class 2
MGKTSFAALRDGSAEIQLFLNTNELGADTYEHILAVLDVGDIVSAGGPVFRTRTNEPSVRVQRLDMAAKALRPLPEKWKGLQDPETRYRQRYLDIITNEESRKRFEARTGIVRAIRQTLDAKGFMEVETPSLQPVYGGGNAVPFTTRHEALSQDFYLRIADELYLKRLLVAGYESVYEICKDYRNEGIDRTHSPEFTMLEAYQAFADLSDMITLTETIVAEAARAATGGTRVGFNGKTVDFTPPWQQVTYRDALLEATGLDLDDEALADTQIHEAATSVGIQFEAGWPRARMLDELMKSLVEPTFEQPTLLTRYPAETTPLAKRTSDDPRYVARFEPFVCGMELGNGYTELNDPIDQRQRLVEQMKGGATDAHPMDEDFLRALEHGMPPAGGMGLGIDRLTMVLTDTTSIREVILFPQLRGPA